MPLTVAEIVRRISRRHQAGKNPGDGALAHQLDVGRVIRRFVKAFVPGTVLDLIDEQFPWARDQRLAMDPEVSDEERMAAIHRLIAPIRWTPNGDWNDREQRAWRELRDRPEAEERPVSQVKRELLEEAVVLVLGDRDRPRQVRIGSNRGAFYLRDDDDAPTQVRPLDLPYSADPDVAGGAKGLFSESPYLHWFRREVQTAATAILLGEPYPAHDDAPDDAWEQQHGVIQDGDPSLVDEESDPLVGLLSGEQHREDAQRLLSVLDRATPRQFQLLSLIAEGATTAEAARVLGISTSTARVQLKRLRDRAV